MWMIGRSQRVEEKKYRPIVRKIRYLIGLEILTCGKTKKTNNGQQHNTTVHRNLKIQQHDPTKKQKLNSGTLEG